MTKNKHCKSTIVNHGIKSGYNTKLPIKFWKSSLCGDKTVKSMRDIINRLDVNYSHVIQVNRITKTPEFTTITIKELDDVSKQTLMHLENKVRKFLSFYVQLNKKLTRKEMDYSILVTFNGKKFNMKKVNPSKTMNQPVFIFQFAERLHIYKGFNVKSAMCFKVISQWDHFQKMEIND